MGTLLGVHPIIPWHQSIHKFTYTQKKAALMYVSSIQLLKCKLVRAFLAQRISAFVDWIWAKWRVHTTWFRDEPGEDLLQIQGNLQEAFQSKQSYLPIYVSLLDFRLMKCCTAAKLGWKIYRNTHPHYIIENAVIMIVHDEWPCTIPNAALGNVVHELKSLKVFRCRKYILLYGCLLWVVNSYKNPCKQEDLQSALEKWSIIYVIDVQFNNHSIP